MSDKLYEILKGWAGIETWHTHHPCDQARFYRAMRNIVKELGANIDITLFAEALRQHVENQLGDVELNDYWEKHIADHTLRAETILEYEQTR